MFFQNQNDDQITTDAAQEIDFNPGLIFEKLDSWLDGFIRMLPNLLIAIILMLIGYFIAKFFGRFVQNRIAKFDRPNLGEMLGGLAKWLIFITIGLMAATIVLPNLNPADIVAGLGVSSVAIGFAFKDILQNWLAGMLILIRQPFQIGDQIVVNGYEGTVEKIETRATIIETYAGLRIVIPNSEIYTNSVSVKTAHELIRTQYDVGIGYEDDIDEAISVIEKAVKDIDGVEDSKGIDLLPWDLAASWVTIRVRWWTDSRRASVVKTKAKVIRAIKYALDEAGIDMPFDIVVNKVEQAGEWKMNGEEQEEDSSSFKKREKA